MTNPNMHFADREEWNAYHGTSLREFNDELTAPQADRINDVYDITLYFGRHGIPINPGVQPQNPIEALKMAVAIPNAVDYEEAADVSKTLQSGDVLFREYHGYTNHDPYAQIFDKLAPQIDSTGLLGSMSLAMGDMALSSFFKTYKAQQQAKIETYRKNAQISAWEYAEHLATFNAARVIYADQDAFDKHNSSIKSIDDHERLMNEGEAGWQTIRHSHRAREESARNVLKTWAVEHVEQAEQRRDLTGRKPRLAMLFGEAHMKSMSQTFDEIGIESKKVKLQVHPAHAALREQAARLGITLE